MVEESRQAQMKLMSSKERYANLTTDIATIEAKLVALNQELNNKNALVKSAEKEVNETELKIKYNLEKKAGLCIR
jgi:chromosome segregation ATPase